MWGRGGEGRVVCVKWNHLTWEVRRFCRKANHQRLGRPAYLSRFGQGRCRKECCAGSRSPAAKSLSGFGP